VQQVDDSVVLLSDSATFPRELRIAEMTKEMKLVRGRILRKMMLRRISPALESEMNQPSCVGSYTNTKAATRHSVEEFQD